MRWYYYIIILFVIILGLAIYTGIPFFNGKIPPMTPEPITDGNDQIYIGSIYKDMVISSPLVVTGKARGSWYFEASFPVTLVDWDGRIIAEKPAQAQGDWMTTDFVPFTTTLEFTVPDCPTGQSYCKKGALILKKDNPSGDPKFDASVEIPVIFK